VDLIVERCAGLDVGKEEVVAAVRTPGTGTRRHQEIRTFSTFTSSLEELAGWLAEQGVTQVVMEATGQYWKPIWYVLEGRGEGFELLLVNARHVKILPGRKTDVADAAWLAELLEHGLLRSSFVPPPEIRRLRDLTRYRKRLIQAHTSECQRVQKTLEDAGIKLDSVASDVLGVSGRAMLKALIGGERDPEVLAQMAKGALRKKLPELRQALYGRFEAHHALLVRLSMNHLEHLETAIAELDAEVDRAIAPFSAARDRLDTITGVGKRAAECIIAEIGADMTRFPTAGHLASWAWFASDFDAEGPPRNDPRLTASSVRPRGAVSAGVERAAAAQEAVRRDEVGDLLAGDGRRDHPGRRGAEVGGGRVHDHRHPPHREGRGAGCPGACTGSPHEGARLGPRGGPRGDRPADRGDQGAGDRAGDRPGKSRLGLIGPVPARVPAELKELVLKTVDEAVAAGFDHSWACSIWRVSDDRVHRWRARRRQLGTLVDRAPGGNPMHGLLAGEVESILAVAEAWGPIDRSHRKLAHRGSYEGLVWVAPSTFRRVLAAHGLVLPETPQRSGSQKRPWPDWLVWAPNRIWIWDVTHFTRARRAVFAIVDMVSRRWIDTLVSVEETATQVVVIFERALEAEGLLKLLTDERLELDPDDPRRPILLAVSDNGPQMTAHDTRAFMTLLAIAQHHGRPHTPTDQAWIESFFGHIKSEWPHLEDITDPAVLEAELARVRTEYNTVRLHESIGYVTPDDEHYGRGDAIREARRQGLEHARQQRLDHHRRTNTNHPEETP
jgi:transposase/transposase InsO family protein